MGLERELVPCRQRGHHNCIFENIDRRNHRAQQSGSGISHGIGAGSTTYGDIKPCMGGFIVQFRTSPWKAKHGTGAG